MIDFNRILPLVGVRIEGGFSVNIQDMSNQALKQLYIECKNLLVNNFDVPEVDEELIINTYNKLFNNKTTFLHMKMAQQLFSAVKDEMAERFFSQ